jgi:hypothetical protein
MTREDSIVVTTAPTDHQVRNLLWGEIGRMHAKARAQLPGEPDQKQLRLGPRWYALGLSTNKPGRFQGFHGSVEAPDNPDEDVDLSVSLEELAGTIDEAKGTAGAGGILFVFDEAAGIEQAIFDAAKGALTSPDSYVLYIGNPDLDIADDHEFVRSHHVGSEFYRIRAGVEKGPKDPFEPEPGSEGAEMFESFEKVPNWIMRPEWIEERKRDYGHGTPLFYSKIWGMFAGADASSRVMPLELLQAAETSEVGAAKLGCHIGVDVAGEGGDENVAALLVDGRVRAVHSWRAPVSAEGTALMQVVNVVMAVRAKWAESLEDERGQPGEHILPWHHVHIEVNGVGAGVCSRFRQRGFEVDRVDMSEKPRGEWKSVCGNVTFMNRRAELYWSVRRLAEEGMFHLGRSYSDAWSQAQWTEYEHLERMAGTTVKMQPKKEIRKLYGRSPDHWDAVVLAFARRRRLTFGTR